MTDHHHHHHQPTSAKPRRRGSSIHQWVLVKAVAATLVSSMMTTVVVVTSVDGFSTIPIIPSVPPPPPTPSKTMNDDNRDIVTTTLPPSSSPSANKDMPVATTTTAAATAAPDSTAPWRIVIDIGREPLSRMPFDWARSGCRMPLVVPCDFVMKTTSEDRDDNVHDGTTIKNKNTNTNTKNMVIPKSDTVSFTASNGAVVKPIHGGSWELTYSDIGGAKVSKDDDRSNHKTKLPTGVSFSLTFPETLQRRDVYVDGGTTLELSGRVYSKAELDALNDAYYQAREETWEMGGKLNDASRRQGAAKKWNEQTGRWEKRYANENPLSVLQNQVKYWSAKARQDAAQRDWPDANDISERGPFPSVDDGLYVAKGGVVRVSKNGPVIGRWSCEPIIDRSLSSSNNRKY